MKPARTDGRLSFAGLLLLLTACLPSPVADRDGTSGQPADAATTAARSIDEAQMEAQVGARVEGGFEAGDTARASVWFEAGLAELVVRQNGSDVEVVAFDASGQPRVCADQAAELAGFERIRLVADEPGFFSFEMRRVGGSPAGSYTLEVTALEPPTAEDLARAAADRLFAEAEISRSRRDRPSSLRAQQRYRQALAEFESLGDKARQAEVLQRLGWLQRKYFEEPRASIRFYDDSQRLYAELGDDHRRSSVLNNLGRVHFQLGAMSPAVEAWKQALALKKSIGDRRGEASSLSNLGLASRYLGELQQALIYYDRALEALHEGGISAELGRAFNNRGRFYRSLGQPDQALADLRRAFRIGRDVGSPALQAMALTAIGQIQLEQGAPATALESLEEALELRETAGSAVGRAVTLRALGEVYLALGRRAESKHVHGRALALFEDQDRPRDAARVYASLGGLALREEKAAQAESFYRRSVELFQQLGDLEGEVSSLFGIARALRARGESGSALATCYDAWAGVDRLRTRAATADLRAAFLAQHQEQADFLVDLLMEEHRRQPGLGYDRRAFEAHERSRARALVDRLSARPRRQADAALAAQESRVSAELELLSRQHADLRQRAGSPRLLRSLESRIDEALRRLRSIRGEIALQARSGQAEGDGVLGIDDIRRQLLDRDSSLLAYRLGAERSYVWLISETSFESFELGPGREITELVRRAHRLLQKSHLREPRARTRQTLEQLSALLLGPASNSLKSTRLWIMADGALHYLPFAALPQPVDPLAAGSREPAAMVARHEIVMAPSASSVVALRRRAAARTWTGSVAVIADGVRGAEAAADGAWPGQQRRARGRLPFAMSEAASIHQLSQGLTDAGAVRFAGTPEALSSLELGGFRIVHLAAHGEIDSSRPELSRLVFHRGDGGPGSAGHALYADEVASLDLPAQLVVLSACETALGQEVRGEGLVGLPQSFFDAGASSVLVSLWKVDDQATAELMAAFYAGLLQDELPAPAALRRAQQSLSRHRAWRAPYFWASFVLLGEGSAIAAKPKAGGDGL